MKFYAHTAQNENGQTLPQEQWQTLSEHLNNTACLARDFALPKFKNMAYFLGLLHDIGKCQSTFQKRLCGDKTMVDHAVCGAKEVMDIFGKKKTLGYLFAYPLIGHHSGLPDKGAEGEDNSDNSALLPRLKKTCEDFSAFKDLISLPKTNDIESELQAFFDETNPKKQAEGGQRYEFLIRYLYSCLTDADFLDTENFVLGHFRKEFKTDFNLCERQLQTKFNSFSATTPLQKARNSLKKQALKNLEKLSGHMFLLDMPTGAGKTLCSIKLALKRLNETGKKRIIYVIPYTSIIEQTAATLQSVFPDLVILQHHSNFDFDEQVDQNDGEVTASDKLKKSTENWDVPLIITTNVQFFESIYSNRVSKLRKFHNIANSIIIFDEIHTLPIKNFVPCMESIKRLVEDFESEVFFLTATMPDFPKLCQKYIETEFEMTDLLPDKNEYVLFDKCSIEFLDNVNVLDKLDKNKSTLVVCNSKKTTLKMFQCCQLEKFHLSTYMTPNHRSKVIEKIREKLKNGEKFVVFSTSLIEAGVDLDFDEVWRELSGVDNILQTAGRCNREGLRRKEDSKTFVFCSQDKPFGEVAIKAEITKGLIEEFGGEGLAKKECMTAYFDRLYKTRDYTMTKTEKQSPFDVDFKTIAKNFEMIDSNTVGVVVPTDDDAALREIEKLKVLGFANRRKLQHHSASVSLGEAQKLISAGVLSNYNGILLLESMEFYSPETGLDVEKALGEDFFY